MLKFANDAASSLAGSISNTATSAQLAAGTGVLFPTLAAGDYFVATLIDAATGLINEIVWVTSVVVDVVTMVRAKEGTTAKPWNANDSFANLITAGQMATMLQQGNQQSGAANYGVDTGTVNAVRCVLNPPLAAPIAGMPIRVLLKNTNSGATTLDPGPGPGNVRDIKGNPLHGGELIANTVVEFMWTGAFYNFTYALTAAAGVNGEVQFNSSGALAGANTFTFDGVTLDAPQFNGAWVGASIPINLGGTGITNMPSANGSTGYCTFPPGFMLQWGDTGTLSAGGGSATVAFPTNFPANCYNVSMTCVTSFGGSGTSGSFGYDSMTPANFRAWNDMPANCDFTYMAIGR
jgi:hypothetical protein